MTNLNLTPKLVGGEDMVRDYLKIGGHGVERPLLELLGQIDSWMKNDDHEVLIGYDTDGYIFEIKVWIDSEEACNWYKK